MHTAINAPLIIAFSNFFNGIKNNTEVNSQSILENLGNAQLDIVIADDDEDDKELFEEAIMSISPQINVTTVADGEELMQKLSAEPLPDLVFLDLNMPCKNGFECLDEIRNITRIKDLPVIIYSTSANPDQIEYTYLQGANFYIKKPSSFIDIKKVLHKILSFSSHHFFSKPARKEFVLQV